MVGGRLKHLAAVAIALCAFAAPVSAQYTTGSISGTVKDPQGGIIPGAAVTLTSDTRGTKLPDVFTNETRRVHVRQRPAGHLHRPGVDGGLQDRANRVASR